MARSPEERQSESLDRLVPLLWVCSVAIWAVLTLANLFLGDLNQDEGWYLYAARLVSEGQLPYIDFANTQGPVMPMAYALSRPLVACWGVAGGRLFTAVLGLACTLCAAALATRLVPRESRRTAGLMAFALVAVNVHQSYFFTIVKTYALSGLLIMLGFLLLGSVGRRPRVEAFLAGVCFALAAGVRSSAGILIPVIFLTSIWWSWRKPGAADGHAAGTAAMRPWSYLAGAAVAGLLVYGPFLVKAPVGVWFALVEYHAGREAGGVLQSVVYKAGFISRLVRAYFVFAALCVAVVLRGLLRRFERHPEGRQGGEACATGQTRGMSVTEAMLWLGAAAITLVHFCTPFPYDDYQVMIFPAAAVALAGLLSRSARDARTRTWLATTVVVLCAAASFSSPINQDWFVGERDRIWWPVKDETPLGKLQRAAKVVRAEAGEAGLLLTQDTYLAVEADLKVPHGLEMGPFSYFPEMTREAAEMRHVLNREMLSEILADCPARVAAFSGWGLSIRSPSVTKLSPAEQGRLGLAVQKRYDLLAQIGNFGQAQTSLQIFTLRPRPVVGSPE